MGSDSGNGKATVENKKDSPLSACLQRLPVDAQIPLAIFIKSGASF
ncbi:hypothetical protein GCM10023310_15340 [Paenibacillus vulneris]